MTKVFKRVCAIFAAFALSAFCIFENTLSKIAKADGTTVVDYSRTDIMDDLSDVDILQYPKNDNGNMEAMRFQEYCYSDKPFYAEYYGLYLYLYNPTQKELKTTTGANSVNFAVAYDTDGSPSYENVGLIYCDKTDDNRFYKFKLSTDNDFRAEVDEYANANDGVRRYDVAGIQVFRADNTLATDYTHSKTYYFSGYADGMSTVSTAELSCYMESLETIELDVQHTYYRTHDYQDYVCDELNTVYFSVDERYFTDYGGLEAIKAEWYEYKTSPIFATQDEDGYNYLKNYIAQEISDSELSWRILWEEDRTAGTTVDTGDFYSSLYSQIYGNYGSGYNHASVMDMHGWTTAEIVSRIDWLFLREDVSNVDDYKIAIEEIKNYAWEYKYAHRDEETFDIPTSIAYPAALWSESIDDDRVRYLDNPDDKRGYMCQEIRADDDTSLTVKEDKSWWDTLWHGVSYEEKGYDPIVILDSADNISAMTVDEFAATYLINDMDKQTVYDYCVSEIAAGKKAVLFRFAVTDYYASNARFDSVENTEMSSVDGYVAQMTSFFGFDVISLSFEDESGVVAVIPTVSDPTDIINGVEPDPDIPITSEEDPWWTTLLEWIFWLLVGGIILYALSPLLKFAFRSLFDAVWWLLCLPFKIIGVIFSGMGVLFKKKK